MEKAAKRMMPTFLQDREREASNKRKVPGMLKTPTDLSPKVGAASRSRQSDLDMLFSDKPSSLEKRLQGSSEKSSKARQQVISFSPDKSSLLLENTNKPIP